MGAHRIWLFVTGSFHLTQCPQGSACWSTCQNCVPRQGCVTPRCEDRVYFVISSHVEGHVGCFHLLTVANSPVMIAGYLLAHWCPSFFWVHPREWDCWVTPAAAAFNQRLCLSPRRLQEEDQQFRTSSLPAIPNPFPELCGPKSPPVPPPGSLPPSQAVAKQVSMPQGGSARHLAVGSGRHAGSLLWEKGRVTGSFHLVLFLLQLCLLPCETF